MPSFGACPVRSRNEAHVVRLYEAEYGIPVVRGQGIARAHSINAAARQAARDHPTRDIFVLCDNDLIPDPVTFPLAIENARAHAGITPHNINRNIGEWATARYLETGQVTDWEDTTKGARSYVVITRDAFAAANGLDERFVGWGPEDASFIYSVTKQVGPMLHLDGVRLHLWHPVDPSKRNQKQLNANRARFRRYRSFRPEAVELLAREYGRWDDDREV